MGARWPDALKELGVFGFCHRIAVADRRWRWTQRVIDVPGAASGPTRVDGIFATCGEKACVPHATASVAVRVVRTRRGGSPAVIPSPLLEEEMKNLIARFVREEEGQDLIEYSLLAALIAVACIAAMNALALDINAIFGEIGAALQGAIA